MSFNSFISLELMTDGTPITYGVVQPGPEDSNGVLFIRGGDIANGRINTTNLRTISQELSNQFKRTYLRGGELLISLVGNPGEVAIVPPHLSGSNIARQVGLIRIDGTRFNPWFVQYYLMSPAGKAQLFSYSLGSVQKVINLKELKRVEIPNFPIDAQHFIVRTLKSLDDKINLNTQTNQTLESIAQAIFKSWFVDFEPVKAKMAALAEGGTREQAELAAIGVISGKSEAELAQLQQQNPEHYQQLTETAALFPSAMVESELGEIPEGWELMSLYETAEYINGGAFKTEHFSQDQTGIPIIKIAELKQGITESTKFTHSDFNKKIRIDNGDVLYSWSGSPETSLEVFKWFGGQGWLNQHIFKLNFQSENQKYFTFYLLKFLKPVLIETAKQKQTTGLGHITVADMKRIQTVSPSNLVLEKFCEVISPIFNKSSTIDMENIRLSKLRDSLLPKLLSGEIDLSESALTLALSQGERELESANV